MPDVVSIAAVGAVYLELLILIHMDSGKDDWTGVSVGKIRKYCIFWGSVGPLWKVQKLRRNIHIHAKLVISNFRFSQIRNVFIFMFFGTGGNVHDPQKPFSLDTPNYSN